MARPPIILFRFPRESHNAYHSKLIINNKSEFKNVKSELHRCRAHGRSSQPSKLNISPLMKSAKLQFRLTHLYAPFHSVRDSCHDHARLDQVEVQDKALMFCFKSLLLQITAFFLNPSRITRKWVRLLQNFG